MGLESRAFSLKIFVKGCCWFPTSVPSTRPAVTQVSDCSGIIAASTRKLSLPPRSHFMEEISGKIYPLRVANWQLEGENAESFPQAETVPEPIVARSGCNECFPMRWPLYLLPHSFILNVSSFLYPIPLPSPRFILLWTFPSQALVRTRYKMQYQH